MWSHTSFETPLNVPCRASPCPLAAGSVQILPPWVSRAEQCQHDFGVTLTVLLTSGKDEVHRAGAVSLS